MEKTDDLTLMHCAHVVINKANSGCSKRVSSQSNTVHSQLTQSELTFHVAIFVKYLAKDTVGYQKITEGYDQCVHSSMCSAAGLPV